MHFVYIIYSETSDRYYVGESSDLEKRLSFRNEGKTKSTKAGIPWKLIHFETHPDRSSALERERFIKRMKSRKFIEKVIVGER